MTGHDIIELHFGENEEGVHVFEMDGTDHTVCGCGWEGEDFGEIVSTEKRQVTCPACVRKLKLMKELLASLSPTYRQRNPRK